MEILIEDIPEEGLEVTATEADAWFAELIHEVMGDAFQGKDSARLNVKFFVTEGNVDVDGTIELTAHPQCDRCLKNYKESTSIPFHSVLAPLYASKRQQEIMKQDEVELVKEDLDFAYYEGDRINLSEFVREQMLLEQPMKHLCSEDCKGLCSHCGKDLNQGPCGCQEKHGDARWEALRNFRPKN